MVEEILLTKHDVELSALVEFLQHRAEKAAVNSPDFEDWATKQGEIHGKGEVCGTG